MPEAPAKSGLRSGVVPHSRASMLGSSLKPMVASELRLDEEASDVVGLGRVVAGVSVGLEVHMSSAMVPSAISPLGQHTVSPAAAE